MSRLDRRASAAVSNRRRLGLGSGDYRPWREPTPAQRKALEDMHRGVPCSPQMRWTLIRDNFLSPAGIIR